MGMSGLCYLTDGGIKIHIHSAKRNLDRRYKGRRITKAQQGIDRFLLMERRTKNSVSWGLSCRTRGKEGGYKIPFLSRRTALHEVSLCPHIKLGI